MNNKILTALALTVVISLTANIYQAIVIYDQENIIEDAGDILLEAKDIIELQQQDILTLSGRLEELTEYLKEHGIIEDIEYDYNVYVSKNGELIYEGHNVFTTAGKNWVKDCLGQGICGATAFKYIAVGNGTAPDASSTSLNSEIAESGLTRAAGTYTSTGDGAWKIEKVFSVTGTVGSVNSTALLNASSTGTMLCGDTFTDTNVANGDSLNITWTESVS